MTDLIDRIEYEPEIFTLVDGRFLCVNGVIVMVFPLRNDRWRIVVHGGKFPYGSTTVGYHSLSWLQNRRAVRAIRKVRAAA